MAYGLEVEEAWSHLLLTGKKAEETRRYTLPSSLIGQRIWLLATNGKPGVATLGNKVEVGSPGATVVGWVVFSGVTHYTTRDAWAAAVDRHLVPDDDGKPYGWKDDGIGKYGWIVSHMQQLAAAIPMPAAKRIKHSIFQLSIDDHALDLKFLRTCRRSRSAKQKL